MGYKRRNGSYNDAPAKEQKQTQHARFPSTPYNSSLEHSRTQALHGSLLLLRLLEELIEQI
jgi:hypothetical protein